MGCGLVIFVFALADFFAFSRLFALSPSTSCIFFGTFTCLSPSGRLIIRGTMPPRECAIGKLCGIIIALSHVRPLRTLPLPFSSSASASHSKNTEAPTTTVGWNRRRRKGSSQKASGQRCRHRKNKGLPLPISHRNWAPRSTQMETALARIKPRFCSSGTGGIGPVAWSSHLLCLHSGATTLQSLDQALRTRSPNPAPFPESSASPSRTFARPSSGPGAFVVFSCAPCHAASRVYVAGCRTAFLVPVLQRIKPPFAVH